MAYKGASLVAVVSHMSVRMRGFVEVSLFSRFISALSTPQRKQEDRPAERLYQSILVASRQPEIYTDFELPDNLDTRFDVLCLHISLVMMRLRQAPEDVHKPLNQELFDRFFADMDFTLREMGVGDLGVGKRVRKMSEAFMGRLTVYSEALDALDDDALAMALARNVRRAEDCSPADRRMAAYVAEKYSELSCVSEASLASGDVDFTTVFAVNRTLNA